MGEPYHWYDDEPTSLRVVDISSTTLSAGCWLSGHGAPPAGSGMLPLDGVNDPWRWSPLIGQWISPVYRVTVAADATFLTDAVLDKSGSMAELDLFLTTATVLRDTNDQQRSLFGYFYKDQDAYGSVFHRQSAFIYRADLPPIEAGIEFQPVTAGAEGIAFLAQAEADWGGPTAVPDATVDTLAALEALGALTIGDPFEFSETTPIGSPGQFYLDVDSRNVYLRGAENWTKISTLPAPS